MKSCGSCFWFERNNSPAFGLCTWNKYNLPRPLNTEGDLLVVGESEGATCPVWLKKYSSAGGTR